MTRDEMLSGFADKLARKTKLKWNDFITYLDAAKKAEKDAILLALNDGNWTQFFSLIDALIKAQKLLTARASIDLVAADDSLTIDELKDIL